MYFSALWGEVIIPTSFKAQTLSLMIPDAGLLRGKFVILLYKFKIRGIFRKSLKCLVKCWCRMCMCGVMQYVDDQGSSDKGQLSGKSVLSSFLEVVKGVQQSKDERKFQETFQKILDSLQADLAMWQG